MRTPFRFKPSHLKRRFVMRVLYTLLFAVFFATGCSELPEAESPSQDETPEPEYTLTADQTHNRFSAAIEPEVRVPSGAVVETHTEEASDGQLDPGSTAEDVENLDFDPIHPLTGPVYVEGAEPGDVLKVTLHEVELGEEGWTAVVPGFGFLSDEFNEPFLKTFQFEDDQATATFSNDIEIPLEPFPGVLGVAPDTNAMLSTIPPRANGGNLDDPFIVEGTTVYLPVQVEGALFSVGDAHAAQGLGEVCGTAIEAPTRIVYEVEVLKDRPEIQEPQYETDDYYAVTGFGETIDEAAEKATRYMIDHLEASRGMDRTEAYTLASLAGDLHIAEVVDVPHMLVTMHLPKDIFTN